MQDELTNAVDNPPPATLFSNHLIRNIQQHSALRGGDGFWYLASPYAQYPFGCDRAAKDICDITGELLSQGVYVFAPIAHGHHIRHNIQPPWTDRDWLDYDKHFLDAARGLIVAKMPGWDVSKGVTFEIDYMQRKAKPIFYLPVDVTCNPVALV